MRTISDSPPKYREVLQMSEKEMLIIKSAIDQYVKYPNQAHAQALAELSSILRKRLNITVVEGSPVSFLQGLIRDYIVLTR